MPGFLICILAVEYHRFELGVWNRQINRQTDRQTNGRTDRRIAAFVNIPLTGRDITIGLRSLESGVSRGVFIARLFDE